MCFILENVNCFELVKVLDKQQAILHEAHNPNTKVNFKEKLAELPLFKEAMTEYTEPFLVEALPYPVNLHAYITQLQTAVSHSLGTCLLQLDVDGPEAPKPRPNDAYRYKYLLSYMAFLKYYHEILDRYFQYIGGSNVVNLSPPGTAEGIATASVSPERSGVQGVPLNLNQASGAKTTHGFAQLLLNGSEEEEEEETPEHKNYEKLITLKTPPVFRLTIIKIIRERGVRKFFDSLTTTGQYLLMAQLVSCALRTAQGNINGENNSRFPWPDHVDAANAFLDSLPKI